MKIVKVTIPVSDINWQGHEFEVRVATGSDNPAIVSVANESGISVDKMVVKTGRVNTVSGVTHGVIVSGSGQKLSPRGQLTLSCIQEGAQHWKVVKVLDGPRLGMTPLSSIPAVRRYHFGWSPPDISFNPTSLGVGLEEVGQYVLNRCNAAFETAERVGQNALDDIASILQSSAECIGKIRDISSVVMNRATEYADELTNEVLDPVYKWIAAAGMPERRSVRMELFRLKNPSKNLYGQYPDPNDFELLDVNSPVQLNNPIVYIHGMWLPFPDLVSETDKVSAVNYWKPFELEHGLFAGGGQNNDAIIVSWDSGISQDELNHVLGLLAIPTPDPFGVALGAAFTELIRRAKLVGEWLIPFARKSLFAGGVKSMIVSHSLGGYVWSCCAGPSEARNNEWWSFEPAVPFEAYGPGGEFPGVRGLYDGVHSALTVFYSQLDLVLTVGYHAATHKTAMGCRGVNKVTCPNIKQIDVTSFVGSNHGPAGYFLQLGVPIREARKPPF